MTVYSVLLEYFNDKKNNSLQIKAYNSLNESVSLNNDFYASNIRLGLLELEKTQYDDALESYNKAKNAFTKIAILTDQEYLNYILNELIRVAIYYLKNRSSKIPSIPNFGILRCVNIEGKDIDCVKEDAQFLYDIIDEKCKHPEKFNLLNTIELFIKNCELLKQSNHNTLYK